MATLPTPNMALPYPDDNTYLKDVPDFIKALALALDKGKVPIFSSDAARDTGVGVKPSAGTLVWMSNASPMPRLIVFDGTAWKRVYPAITQVTSGSAAPTGTAETGSIYVQFG